MTRYACMEEVQRVQMARAPSNSPQPVITNEEALAAQRYDQELVNVSVNVRNEDVQAANALTLRAWGHVGCCDPECYQDHEAKP